MTRAEKIAMEGPGPEINRRIRGLSVQEPDPERRVTLIGPLPPPYGGISVHLFRLATALTAGGWDVGVLSAGRQAPSTAWPSKFLGNSLARHYFTVWRNAQGVVHIHDRITPLTFLATAAARSRRLPVVLTIHGVPHHIATRRPGLDPFLRRALLMATHVVAVQEEIAASIAGWAKGLSVVVSPAFLPPAAGEIDDLDPEVRRWIDSSGDGPIATIIVYRLLPPFAGRSDVYGLSLLAPALGRLTPGVRKLRVALLLAQGPADAREREFLQREVAHLQQLLGGGLGVFVGKYAPPIIARASVLIRPTRTDGDPVSIREALSLGVPVVCSDAAVRPAGVILHRSGDSGSLATGIEAALGGTPRGVGPPSAGTQPECLSTLVRLYKSAWRQPS